MIRVHLKKMIAEKELNDNRKITIKEIAEKTGINRMTLSKIINHRDHNTVTDNLAKLCAYFDCSLNELATYVKKDEYHNSEP